MVAEGAFLEEKVAEAKRSVNRRSERDRNRRQEKGMKILSKMSAVYFCMTPPSAYVIIPARIQQAQPILAAILRCDQATHSAYARPVNLGR